MSTGPSPLPSPLLNDQSGWFPSDRSAKARFKALFTRAKSEKAGRQGSSSIGSAQHLESRPCASPQANFATRGRSTTWSNKQRESQHSGKQQRCRNMTSWDPPPLIQAYTQAKMHTFLDIPSTLTDTLFRNNQQRDSTSGESSSRSSLDNHLLSAAAEDAGLRHKRNCSGASTCSLSQKLVILTRSGYILQYHADGFNDRLPEKILELGPDSLAFASDDIPGKHWVLRVSHAEQSTSQASRNTWSKLMFKHSEDKKLVKDLLLIFDDAISLGLWLTAIRKEIELLGGLQYRPDSRGPEEDESKLPSHPPLRARRSLPVFSRSSSHLPVEKPSSPVLLPPMPQRSARKISRSTTDSSIHTLTDLDNIREPSFSDDRSVSTAHTSFTSSTTSGFHAVDSFSSAEYYEPPVPGDSQSRESTPTQDDLGELSMYMATPKRKRRPNPPPPPPPRTTSLDGKPDTIPHDLLVPTSHSDHQAAASWESKARPISTIAPLPEPGHIRKISARYRCELQGLPPQPLTPVSRPGSLRSRSSSYTQDSPDGVQKRSASYSLFPKTPSQDQSQIISSVGLPSPPATTPGAAFESMCNVSGLGPDTRDEEKEQISRGSQLASRRLGKALSIDTRHAEAAGGHIGHPQRTPSVTDAHLETCFGAHPDAPRRKSSAKSSLSTITTTTGAAPQVLRKHRHVRSRKSMPSLVHPSTPPSGPPPSGPLPALPTETCLPLPNKFISVSCGPMPTRSQRPPLKHSKAESAGPWLGSNTLVTTQPQATKPATTHKRNGSSVSTVASVRHVTAWLQSDRVAAFSAKCDAAPTLNNINVPDSPAFSCGFEKLLS
ncbi:hypothetical protein A1O3_10446 [Capronia epimyces CBS 606.96]|uniref:PH domain-containing protein n=1 Tax=Capronia epimyces CBS 606.96 TaxID=1182542 RepID=W9XAL5_9EURO|nr:uncharacterized protein A1O3_10446 [Capronia epimyces CBS 606.96]EXJ77288.1 hypothetical protein A1O3_10446 [Capronia epimyces CBS 606.96]